MHQRSRLRVIDQPRWVGSFEVNDPARLLVQPVPSDNKIGRVADVVRRAHEFRELDQLRPARFHYEVRPLPSRLRGDRDEATAPREQRGRAYEEVAANRVEDEIDCFELINELSAPPVDNFVRSKRTCSLERIRRCGRDDVGAAPAPKLCRKLTDTAHRSMHEHSLAGCETTVDEEALPGAKPRQWDRGALHVAERCRLRRQE